MLHKIKAIVKEIILEVVVVIWFPLLKVAVNSTAVASLLAIKTYLGAQPESEMGIPKTSPDYTFDDN